jgi:hypothetical protein
MAGHGRMHMMPADGIVEGTKQRHGQRETLGDVPRKSDVFSSRVYPQAAGPILVMMSGFC